jgi:PAS domain S-box-containing protein
MEGVVDLRSHLQARPDLVRDIFRHKRVVAANRMALARTGYQSVEDMDRNLAEVMSEQAMIMFIEELDAIWRGKDRLTLEKVYHTKLGETIHTLINWEVGRKDGGRDLANVRLVFTEITERKLAEEALRQSEERYRALFEQAVGGIYRTSPEGRFLSANPALAKILGFSQPGEMSTWFESINLSTLYVQPGRREEYIAALNARGVLNDFESEVRHRGGGTVWVSENARAVRDEHGRLLYYEGFVTDISARRQLESEIGRASKLEALGILAGGIAHDFNNILTVVLGNVSLAEGEVGPDNPAGKRLQEAKRATLRARDLTLQLLTFAKGGEPVRTTLELPGLVKESAGFALHGAKARGEFHFARGLWPVNADKGQLGQVVQNLVINAVQAMPDGGVITISADNVEMTGTATGGPALPAGHYVQLTVADTGVGIPPENLAKIFDPYFTTKEQGTGLGLASVYSIVRKHEGHIVVESEPGHGARFRVWLPAVAVASLGVAGDTGSRSPGSLSPFRVRVLFMDDEPSIRSMAVHFMQRIGYACEVATNGTEAVQKYQEALAAGDKFGLVVMDLTVPGGMGGREAMEILRRIDPGICAIVSSGYSRDPVLANYKAHGFQAVLAKPYGIDQLAKVMRAALDGQVSPA